MRDYKNVTVPKQYRTNVRRATVKRAETTRIARGSAAGAATVKSVASKLLLVAVLAAGGWLGWQAYQIMTHAEMCQISGVDVKGVQQLTEDDLKKIVGPFTGENIFKADLEAAVKRASANPWVQSVSIHRRLPNRISMVVTERVPVAVLDTGADRFLMDHEGVVIKRLAKEHAAAWPLPVVVVKGYRARPGEAVASEGAHEALRLFAEITARGGWRPEDVVIKASAPELLTIVYADHEFRIGSGRYSEKLRRLAEIMEDVKRRNLNLAYVDLRPERQVAVMVKNTKGQGSGAKGKGR